MKTEEIREKILNAFEPNVPAVSRYYAHTMEARGGSDLVKKIIRRLVGAKNENLRYLFTGHLGCGKSSELLHLRDKLEKEETIFPVYIDFEKYLDKQDTTLEDIFLGMISEIAVICRDKFDIKTKAESYSLIRKISGFFGEISPKAELGLPAIAKLQFERIKQNPNLRQQIHAAIKDDAKKSLFGELNQFIMEVELHMKQKTSFNKLLIIADSLEKIKRFEKDKNSDAEANIESQKKLFIDRAEQLTGIATNIIYTVPLSLYTSTYGTQLQQIYGNNVDSLPMVKVHYRGDFDKPFGEGIKQLKEVINRRLRYIGIKIDEIFEPEALNYLLAYSGGNIRTLLRLIQESSIWADEFPVNMTAAKQSVGEEVRSFAVSVREEYWKNLAELELSADQQIENGNPAYSKMIESLAVLEYMNGEENPRADKTWYAVNPAIRLTIKFQEAVKKLKAERKKDTPETKEK